MYELLGTQGDRFIEPGTRVRLAIAIMDDGMVTPQPGIVIHCWRDEETSAFESYVAFFGDELPQGKPLDEPYIVQHKTTALETIVDEQPISLQAEQTAR